jgi:hypothetical protein
MRQYYLMSIDFAAIIAVCSGADPMAPSIVWGKLKVVFMVVTSSITYDLI